MISFQNQDHVFSCILISLLLCTDNREQLIIVLICTKVAGRASVIMAEVRRYASCTGVRMHSMVLISYTCML